MDEDVVIEWDSWIASHIAEHGIDREEVESVLRNPENEVVESERSGRPVMFGQTHTGKYIAVVFLINDDDYPTRFRPITAYEVRRPRR